MGFIELDLRLRGENEESFQRFATPFILCALLTVRQTIHGTGTVSVPPSCAFATAHVEATNSQPTHFITSSPCDKVVKGGFATSRAACNAW